MLVCYTAVFSVVKQCVCGRVSNAILFAFFRNQTTLLVTRGEQLTRYKSGLNVKKWFAPVTFVQIKDTKETTLLLLHIYLFGNLSALRFYQLNSG